MSHCVLLITSANTRRQRRVESAAWSLAPRAKVLVRVALSLASTMFGDAHGKSVRLLATPKLGIEIGERLQLSKVVVTRMLGEANLEYTQWSSVS